MIKETQTDPKVEWYINAFEKFEKSLNGDREIPFHEVRRKAIEKFQQLGFPTTRIEEWKYTNIKPILDQQFTTIDTPKKIDKKTVDKYRIKGIEENLIVFVNGQYQEDFSDITLSAKNLVIKNISRAFAENPDLIKTYLTRYASYHKEPFIALNTAFAREGTFIFVPENTILEEPIHIINISDPGQVTFQSHPRNLMIIGKNSQVSLVESLNHLSDNVYFQNSVTEVLIRENAIIDHIKIQDESKLSFRIATTQVQQEQSSVYHAFSIDLGGALVRNNLNIGLAGENAEANLFGFYYINGKQHLDNHTNIDHLVPNCNSNELYKGILDGKSRAVFSGTIFVEKDAQKTNAFQSNKNLLLSNEAEIDSKPQLKIFADDVKCSHGATIGQIDDQALFYLRQRGVSLEDAHILLRQAFAVDVFEKIRIPAAKAYINELVSERLKS